MNILVLLILLALTGFFVAVEFAVVKVRKSRIEQLAETGKKRATIAYKVIQDLDYYLSACQLGITITAIALGAFTKPYVQKIIEPLLQSFSLSGTTLNLIAYVVALAIVTYLHVVIGEMAPKTLAIQFSERVTLQLATPLYYFGKVMAPFIHLLNGTSRFLLTKLGVKPKPETAHFSEEELQMIATESFHDGKIDRHELAYLLNVFKYDERTAKDIMTPRTQMVTVDATMTSAMILETIAMHQCTRYPVTLENDKDHIQGFVKANQLLTCILSEQAIDMTTLMKPTCFIFEHASLHEALTTMQQHKAYMAIIVDEYGGTAGLLTREDIVEELVGEIRDEFDTDELDDIYQLSPHEYVLNGLVLLDDIEEKYPISFTDREGIDTIGGWLLQCVLRANHPLEVGLMIQDKEQIWVITAIENFQITQVLLKQQVREVNPS